VPTHSAYWGIVVGYTENTHLWTAGSAHGSSYRYDREVPIVLLGAGIDPGVANTAARTVDVAPTLAALAGISFPDNVAADAFMPPTRSAGLPNRILIDQKGRLAWVVEPSDRLEDAEAARKIASDVLSSPQGRDPHVLYVLGNLDTPTP
jgi:hypothetical protein